MGWDSVEGTLNLGLSSGKHIHLGEESVFRVRNSTGSTIGKGTALYASGVEPSGRIQVTPYVANGSVREVRFMGLATESISSGVNGFVQHFGYVRDLDTRGTSSTSISVGNETWAAGDLLYVHPTVPGKLTNVKPQHEIVVAIIIIRHESTGILFVRPTSGGHLEDIHDISLSSLSNEDILIYNSASSIWVNSPKQNIINTASAAAVSYLVDGAPETLNTLNELAAALDDNADILDGLLTTSSASTIYLTQSNASTVYAPKASPTFTGTVNFTSASVIGIDALPSQSSNSGKYLTTDGTTASWELVDTLPTQTGNSGKYLTTNGASASWAELNTNSVMSRWTKAYSASTSTISGSDDNSLSLTYSPSFISVYINGILIDPTNYTATNGTIISVVDPIQVNDIVEVMSSSVATIANTYTKQEIDAKYNTLARWTKTYSASATIVSGNDDSSNALSYVVGYENVYLNGILLTPISDYARTSASVITLNQAVISGDIIDVVELEPFNIANTYTTTQADNKFLTQTSASTTYLTQSNASTLYSLPTQTENSGRYLTTNGASASWSSVDALPTQTGNSGRYLTTNGASASWGVLDLSSKADKLNTFDPETASYTLIIGNADQIVEMNVSSANTLTVPLDSSVNFPTGTQITILQTGTGQTTITPATVGVTINATPGLKLRTQWSSATLIKRAANTWVAIGDLSP
jgi:hypothetical protein